MDTDIIEDKKRWGPGPWQKEPDRIEWHYLGFPCLMVRNTRVTGSWCGYVGVPPGHRFYRKGYQKIDVKVHGGLTWSDKNQYPQGHEPSRKESKALWWLGFDCSHAFDLSPRLEFHMRFLRKMAPRVGMPSFPRYTKKGRWADVYRDAKYVKKEVQSLARQLRQA